MPISIILDEESSKAIKELEQEVSCEEKTLLSPIICSEVPESLIQEDEHSLKKEHLNPFCLRWLKL